MTRFLIVGGLVLAVATVAIIGCGPRVQVAKDAIIDKLDKALGELKVKRAKIEQTKSGLQKKLEDLRIDRHVAKAKLDLMASKKEKAQSTVNALKTQGEKLSKLMAQANESESGTLTVNDKEYSKEELKEAGDDLISRINQANTKLTGLITSYDVMEKAYNFLQDQEDKSANLMKTLEQKISEIDAKKFAVETVREASLTGGNSSVADELAQLEKEIEELGVSVDAALSLETEKMNELTDASTKIDELLTETPDLDETQRKLDELLK